MTGEPSEAATRRASVTEAAVSQRGLHDPFASTGEVLRRSSAKVCQAKIGRAGPAGTRRAAVGSSQVACQREQSSIRVATSCPQQAQARFGPSRPSRPQQKPSLRSGIRTVPWASPGARTMCPGAPKDRA
ncbi:hypothetical protein GCM10010193_39890 [Kitasatospora atroaurantiaca]